MVQRAVSYNPRDHFFKKAKDQNFAARSVFKLEEIDQKFKVVKSGQMVLDLGAAPGSWSQYCSQKIGPQGRLLGVDLTEIDAAIKKSLKNSVFIQADLRDLNLENVFAEHGFVPPFDLVISDMAPKTTGIRITDQARSVELVELAIEIAQKNLRPGGHFVAKLFHCDDFTKIREDMKKRYEKFEAIKPEATRKISKEIFLVGLRKKS